MADTLVSLYKAFWLKFAAVVRDKPGSVPDVIHFTDRAVIPNDGVNPIERMNREIRRRTKVVGNFPDGRSALMLVCARLRHMSGTQWGKKRYLDMHLLVTADAMTTDA